MSRSTCVFVPSLCWNPFSGWRVRQTLLFWELCLCHLKDAFVQCWPPWAHYLHIFSLFVPGPSEGNSLLLLLLCSPLSGPALLFWSLQMRLDQSLISAVVPWSHEAHGTHTSITEMPLTQKFTLGAVKFTPKSWEKPYRNLFLIVKSPAKPVILHICIAKMEHMWGEMKNGGVM